MGTYKFFYDGANHNHRYILIKVDLWFGQTNSFRTCLLLRAYAQNPQILHAGRILKLTFCANSFYGAQENGIGDGSLLIMLIISCIDAKFVAQVGPNQQESSNIPTPPSIRKYSQIDNLHDRLCAEYTQRFLPKMGDLRIRQARNLHLIFRSRPDQANITEKTDRTPRSIQ